MERETFPRLFHEPSAYAQGDSTYTHAYMHTYAQDGTRGRMQSAKHSARLSVQSPRCVCVCVCVCVWYVCDDDGRVCVCVRACNVHIVFI